MAVEIRQAIEGDERLARIESNAKRFRSLPRVNRLPDNDLKIAICGYGPSLQETFREIQGCDRVMTTSGAHDFLMARGVCPDYHVELDPREHKIIRKPCEGTTYLIAAHCHPKMFAALRKSRVEMYYAFTSDDKDRQWEQFIRLERGDGGMFNGRSNVGMLAMSLARLRGYRNFELHGMDCCYRGGKVWAGPHSGKKHDIVTIRCDGREYETSALMLTGTDDFFRTLLVMPNTTFTIHGDGLLAARLKIYKRDPELALSPKWWEPVSFMRMAA